MKSNLSSAPKEQLVSEVRKLFAEKTDYPSYFLDSDSMLADDLGIDQGTIGEVLAQLRQRFDLPEEVDLPSEPEATISKIAEGLERSLTGNRAIATEAGNGGTANNGGNGAREARARSASDDRHGGVKGNGGNGSAAAGSGFDKSDGNGGNGARPDGGASSTPSAAPSPVRAGTADGSVSLAGEVREVFAEVTRYPLEILSLEADLEEELGIDSVKLGEVFSVLRERFDLPEERIGIPEEQLRTIGGIAEALEEFLGHEATVTPADPIAVSPAASASPVSEVPEVPVVPVVGEAVGAGRPAAALAPSPVPSDMEEQVRQVFAEVTRYPLEILTTDAALEEDLGIDSVKLGEVFSVLRERFDLPEEQIGIPEEQLRTIGGIAEALGDFLREQAGAVAPAGGADVAPVVAPAAASISASVEAPSARAETGATVIATHAALTPENKPFAGKVAFVSGSGRGLGKEIASYLAELGAHVVINSFHSRQAGIETAEEIRSRGGEVDHIWGSVANQDQLMAIFDQIEEKVGHLDFFVSNASNGMLAPLSEITVEHWEKAFRTNVVGLHQSALRAADLMRPRGGGKIITMSSPAAHGYVDYFGCMGAVKAAVESLTRSLAIELAPDKIQVNCVSPGPVYGELLDKWPESKKLIARWEGNTAYERLCEPRDVSHFVAYLLSDPVKLFTGSVLVMDGGISSQGW